MSNHNNFIRQHFDRIAPAWDSMQDEGRIQRGLRELLQAERVGENECVLDIGCGTGVSSAALLEPLSAQGKLFALDLSSQMLQRATAKIIDHRCVFLQAAAQQIPLASGSVDRCLSFSAWPHFEDTPQLMRELRRVLIPGGKLHIWHHDSRETVTSIHRRIGGVVGDHSFPPPEALIRALQNESLELTALSDTSSHFRATFRKA